MDKDQGKAILALLSARDHLLRGPFGKLLYAFKYFEKDDYPYANIENGNCSYVVVNEGETYSLRADFLLEDSQDAINAKILEAFLMTALLFHQWKDDGCPKTEEPDCDSEVCPGCAAFDSELEKQYGR